MTTSFDLKKLINIARHSVNILLSAALIVVILLAALVVNQSVTVVKNAHEVVTVPKTSLVRVNFGLYNQIMERFNLEQDFRPTPVISRNPFGIVETVKAMP